MKPIPREVATKYIEQYFKKRWLLGDEWKKILRVNEAQQPKFWEMVIRLCENFEADVSDLVNPDERAKFFLLTAYKGEEFSIGNAVCEGYLDKSIETIPDLARYIASQIINAEHQPADTTNLRLFLLERQVAELNKGSYR